jgi:predicted RNase H-like HicB family nuclease
MARSRDKERLVKAIWDAEAGVWVATSDDVPGLVTESKSFEALLKKLRSLVPELLELNGVMPRSGRAPYRVVAERREDVQAAE